MKPFSTRWFWSFLAAVLVGWASGQDVARAELPSAEPLWELLGSAFTVAVDVRSPSVTSILVVSMYRGEAVVADSKNVRAEGDPVVMTLTAGALRPGVALASCERGVAAFFHHRIVFDDGAGGFGSGMARNCVQIENLRHLSDRFGAGPLNRPPEFHDQNPQSVPLDTWLLFGATDVRIEGVDPSFEAVESSFAYYFQLSTQPEVPPTERWELPAYTTWQEAYRAFGGD